MFICFSNGFLLVNFHAQYMCAAMNESFMRMGIYLHPFRLPRKGRGTGD